MRRVFDLDVLVPAVWRPRVGDRTIEAGAILRTILDHLGLPTEPADPASGPSASADGRLFPDFPA